MSARALCLGVRDRLRQVLADELRAECVTHEPTGRPPATAGQRHVTVSFAGWRTLARVPEGDDRGWDVTVVLTYRAPVAPADRQGSEVARPGEDFLLDMGDRVCGYLLNDWTTMALVNGHIEGAGVTTNGFCEPFLSASCGAVEEKPASWFSANKQARGGAAPGLALTVRLRDARRIRLLGTVE